MFEQLGLIGCGLMGGSFALALKRAGLVRRVVGYSKSPSTTERAGRDSKRVIETPWVFNGTRMSCTAPGRLATETTRLVQSLPEAGGAGSVCGRQITAKRVRLKASS